MQLTVIDVGTLNTHAAKNGLNYQSIMITYKSDKDVVSSKKLMSFTNKKLFEASQKWVKGTVVNVTETINSRGYPEWIDFKVQEFNQDIAEIDSDIPF